MPVGNTHYYETPSYEFQVGAGRNWSKTFGVLLQFDYDHFGLQGATLANQAYIYNYCTQPRPGCDLAAGTCARYQRLDGNNHVWSFTLNPTFTRSNGRLSWEPMLSSAAASITRSPTSRTPTTEERVHLLRLRRLQRANATFDHYTSNAGGVNGGFGLTYKVSRFSNERFYIEGRYVVVMNQPALRLYRTATSRPRLTTVTTLYPANSNRTTYVPITVRYSLLASVGQHGNQQSPAKQAGLCAACPLPDEFISRPDRASRAPRSPSTLPPRSKRPCSRLSSPVYQ